LNEWKFVYIDLEDKR